MLKRGVVRTVLLTAGFNLILAAGTFAAPPFLTDDPVPTDYQHWEVYLFASGGRDGAGYAINGPAVELDYGGLPDTQFSLTVPMTTVSGGGAPTAFGLGDTQLGIKYRFVHETNGWPQIAFFPAVILPTGDAARGLGNGRAWFQLPLWLQKSFGPWTTYGGGGEALNSAPGERDYPFGGWLLQRDFGPHLTLGGELFAQGRDADDDEGFATLNLGGSINFTGHFSLIFNAGHSVAGEENTIWYAGLYWTW